jgi:hypothetical protein
VLGFHHPTRNGCCPHLSATALGSRRRSPRPGARLTRLPRSPSSVWTCSCLWFVDTLKPLVDLVDGTVMSLGSDLKREVPCMAMFSI